jgi:hypothetical protein
VQSRSIRSGNTTVYLPKVPAKVLTLEELLDLPVIHGNLKPVFEEFFTFTHTHF